MEDLSKTPDKSSLSGLRLPRGGSQKRLPELERVIGYTFKRRELLCEALTHKSAASETSESVSWNERLEFLGDSVLGLAVSRRLMTRFPEYQEGELSRLRASLVNEASLAELSRQIGLGEYLYVGRGEHNSGGRKRSSLLADAFESLLGAIYSDGGFEPADQFVGRMIDEVIADESNISVQIDHKTILQELTQEKFRCTPIYKTTLASGPDHRKSFEVAVLLEQIELAKGDGASKKKASQDAAALALTVLADEKKMSELHLALRPIENRKVT